ncbi:hypothetical protein O9992_15240 [Vibrio lentus]|nr:hypothetical protein [Vibrio lentus]
MEIMVWLSRSTQQNATLMKENPIFVEGLREDKDDFASITSAMNMCC